jgi:hypothetical protein
MSPVVFRHGGAKFQFYANEGNPREPVHIHAMKDGIDAKFWRFGRRLPWRTITDTTREPSGNLQS